VTRQVEPKRARNGDYGQKIGRHGGPASELYSAQAATFKDDFACLAREFAHSWPGLQVALLSASPSLFSNKAQAGDRSTDRLLDASVAHAVQLTRGAAE